MSEAIELISKMKLDTRRLALKRMCKNMVRKDFEMIRIQDVFSNIFRDVELYSHYNDEFSSIEFTIYLAFNQQTTKLVRDPFDYMIDCGFKLAFDYTNTKGCVLTRMRSNSENLVDLIFEAAEEKDPREAKIKFLEAFIKSYSQLELDEAKAQLIETIKEKEFENEMFC